MEFRVLRPVEVCDPGGARQIGGAKSGSLIAALLAHGGESISQDQLAEAIAAFLGDGVMASFGSVTAAVDCARPPEASTRFRGPASADPHVETVFAAVRTWVRSAWDR